MCNMESFGTDRSQKAGYVQNAYYNGFGRYVCQLARITFKFSKHGGSSKGIRDFIETDIVDFSRSNPGIVVYLKPRRKPTPVMICEYLNGTQHWMNLNKFNRDEMVSWLDYYVTRSGIPIQRFIKGHRTDWPTVQGVWTPFLNLPPELNKSSFPNQERAEWKLPLPSASEQLLRMIEENKNESGNLIIKKHPSTAKD